MSSRSIDLKVGESMKVGSATITLVEKSGKLARLRIVAPDDVPIKHPLVPAPVPQASRGVIFAPA